MYRFKIWFVNFSVLCFCISTPAFADLWISGLHPMLDPDLIIERQEVTLSVDQISTTYVINNSSNAEIVQTLALPQSMSVNVDNRNIELHHTQFAISNNGQDVSNILKNLGVPFDPITAIHSIDASQNRDIIRSKLKAQLLLDKDAETPQWLLKSFYYWRQHFPAQSRVTINEIYKPNVSTKIMKITGADGILYMPVNALKTIYNLAIHWSLDDPITASKMQKDVEKQNPYMAKFCPSLKDYEALLGSNGTLASDIKSVETKQINYPYLLDANSSLPVKRFTLKIANPSNMHPMLCWNGDLKTLGKNLVFEAENYLPLQNLSVLYVEKR